MDYNKLANLLYPNAQNWEVYEERYVSRNLPKGAEVTRFAPSPTGFLHIGHFFQCLINEKIANQTNGSFFMRIEDTDKKREVPNSTLAIAKTLALLNLHVKEGIVFSGYLKNNYLPVANELISVGKYGPYKQSRRLEIYEAYAKKLVASGRAFPCFCEKPENLEEIEENREKELQASNTIQDKDVCRNLTYEQIEQNIKNGKPWALRLLSIGNPEKTFVFNDIVKGQRTLHENTKDVVLIKSNKIPVYAFAHAVDDHLMQTTIVIRGEEWYPSVPAHIEIFEALGFKKIKYAHNPVICKIDAETGNKRKLSKRKDKEANMQYFIDEGYYPDSLKEYLFNLANSNFEIWRRDNPDLEFEEFPFDTKKLNTNNPMFDMNKLIDVAKNVMLRANVKDVYSNLCLWAWNNNEELYGTLRDQPSLTLRVLSMDRTSGKPQKKFYKFSDFLELFGFFYMHYLNQKSYDLENENIENFKHACAECGTIYTSDMTKTEWFENIKQTAEKLGYSTNRKEFKANPELFKGDLNTFCRYIRLALTKQKESPDLFDIMRVLGQAQVSERLKIASEIN